MKKKVCEVKVHFRHYNRFMRTANVSQLTQSFTDRLRSQNIKLLRGIFCNVLIFIKHDISGTRNDCVKLFYFEKIVGLVKNDYFFEFVRTILNRSFCVFFRWIFFIFLWTIKDVNPSFFFLNDSIVLKNFVRSQKRWPALSGTRFNK